MLWCHVPYTYTIVYSMGLSDYWSKSIEVDVNKASQKATQVCSLLDTAKCHLVQSPPATTAVQAAMFRALWLEGGSGTCLILPCKVATHLYLLMANCLSITASQRLQS